MGTPIPLNAASFTLGDLARITGGAIVTPGSCAPEDVVASISTDTRTLTPGSLFVALAGERFDGHDYLETANQNGARAAIVERDVKAPAGLALVRCSSTLTALGDLARTHLERWRSFDGKRIIVAITGSAGKTTTRVAVTAMLEALYPGAVHSTKGNLNNLVGVPMVVFGLDEHHHVAVIEMGMNQPGEIAQLAAIARPDVAIVTLVAAAHVEGVGSIDGVAHEKGALYRALLPSGIAIANGDDDRVRTVLKGSSATQRISYGTRDNVDVRIVDRRPEGFSLSRITLARPDGQALEFVTPLIGEAGAYACAAAVSVAEALAGERLTSTFVEAAFAAAEVGGGAGRLVPRPLGRDVVVIDDSYNANPASSAASIRTAAELARASNRRLVLVLGAMYELGVESTSGHDAVGRAAASSGATIVFAIGGEARRIADRAEEVGVPNKFFQTSAEAAPVVVDAVRPGDLVLVKGSRGVGTEKIVRELSLAFGERVANAEATA
ncbi:MAG: UDP-N-acetylmuramoyl-tripeptide--D-alanyl-D-alanine ligase [Polyangiaceae bacterium]|nr:UDP-N-acetylmuramoyl-tripeptide--D-alanyl-D-alanine ligase [Polyangiaceae bacterium]